MKEQQERDLYELRKLSLSYSTRLSARIGLCSTNRYEVSFC